MRSCHFMSGDTVNRTCPDDVFSSPARLKHRPPHCEVTPFFLRSSGGCCAQPTLPEQEYPPPEWSSFFELCTEDFCYLFSHLYQYEHMDTPLWVIIQ